MTALVTPSVTKAELSENNETSTKRMLGDLSRPNPRGPVFMTLLERLFGTEATTRTWDTVRKCAAA